MKHFIVNILISLIIGILICGVFEYYFAATCENNYTYKNEYLNTHAEDIKILLLGNSYFENSVNPHLLGDSVFDAAISGRWIYYDYLILERYIPELTNLKTVIFPLGYAMPFASYHNHPLSNMQKMYMYQYASFMSIFFDKLPEKYTTRFLLFTGMNCVQEESYTCDEIGYDKIIGQLNGWDTIHNVSSSFVQEDKTLSADTAEYKHYLLKLAELCYNNNIRFIVVTSPCHDVYINNTECLGHQIRYDIIHRVQKQYPLEYYDYLHDSEFRADSIYYNCSHLNHEGASKFSIRLKRDLSL